MNGRNKPDGGRSQEAARGAVPADEGGAGHARRGGKVLGWRKGERHGMVVHGARGPGRGARSGGGTVRVGGRVPWGAKAEFCLPRRVRRRGPGRR